jgi:hypothetical protein
MRPWKRSLLLRSFFPGNLDLLPFAIYVSDSQSPEGNQIGSGHEFGKECWQKFPVPAEQVNHYGGNREVEDVICGRQSAFGE